MEMNVTPEHLKTYRPEPDYSDYGGFTWNEIIEHWLADTARRDAAMIALAVVVALLPPDQIDTLARKHDMVAVVRPRKQRQG